MKLFSAFLVFLILLLTGCNYNKNKELESSSENESIFFNTTSENLPDESTLNQTSNNEPLQSSNNKPFSSSKVDSGKNSMKESKSRSVDSGKSFVKESKSPSYVDLPKYITFYSIKEFEEWINQLNIADESSQANRDYTSFLYSDWHKMLVKDGFYLLPVIPDDLEVQGIYISISKDNIWFDYDFHKFSAEGENRLSFFYRTDGKATKTNGSEIATKNGDTSIFDDLKSVKTYKGQNYYLEGNSEYPTLSIWQYFGDYPVEIYFRGITDRSKLSFLPAKFDNKTDVSAIVSKINFKKVMFKSK